MRQEGRRQIPEIGFCQEKNRLMDEFLEAMHEVNMLLSQQIRAVIDEDPDFNRFDLLIHLANEKKDRAKYAWMIHVDSHNC
jgi:glutaredoxin-related protein